MNINLSDIIWTIICFSLFVLILNGLLIKPVLKHMDERKDKIARAHLRALEREQAIGESRERALEARAASEKAAAEEGRKAVALAEENARLEIKDYSEKLGAREKDAVLSVGASKGLTDEKLASFMDKMIEAYTDKLTKDGEG